MLFEIFSNSEIGAPILEAIDLISLGVEVLAVVFIVIAVVSSIWRYVVSRFQSVPNDERYREFRHSLARSLLLGLEMLIAADIIRTVALEASVQSVAVLGLLVIIRTFLSWSLVVEIEGHWPWQPKPSERE